MHPELLVTLDDRVRQVMVNWARLVVDALEGRIDLAAFRLGGKPGADKQLSRVFEYTDLGAGYPVSSRSACRAARSFRGCPRPVG